jgi:amidohydrolase
VSPRLPTQARRLEPLLRPHLGRLQELRRDLHRHPELAYREARTAARVVAELTALGLEPRAIADTGVVADLGASPAVALRADLDALPIDEQGDVEHRSTIVGAMHACGHDGHVAILVGAAAALAASRARLGRRGVRLLFQPAEEGGAGAARLIAEGALDGVEAVYGLHNWPATSRGAVAVRAGAMMAASGLFEIVVAGRGGHGSQPHLARDPVLAAAQVVTALQALISRERDPLEPAVVSVCSIHGGSARNVIPDQVTLAGTTRALDDAGIDRLGERLAEVARGVAMAARCDATVEARRQYPAVVNHPASAHLAAEAARDVLGPRAVTEAGLPVMGAEDFSFYLRERPGAFLFLGAGREGEASPPLHSSRYDFDDSLILPGALLMLRIVERTLGVTLAGPERAD